MIICEFQNSGDSVLYKNFIQVSSILQEMLLNFTAVETLEGEIYACQQCNSKCNCICQCNIL